MILARFAFEIRLSYFGEVDPDINNHFIEPKRWLHGKSILMEMITGMFSLILDH